MENLSSNDFLVIQQIINDKKITQCAIYSTNLYESRKTSWIVFHFLNN